MKIIFPNTAITNNLYFKSNDNKRNAYYPKLLLSATAVTATISLLFLIRSGKLSKFIGKIFDKFKPQKTSENCVTKNEVITSDEPIKAKIEQQIRTNEPQKLLNSGDDIKLLPEHTANKNEKVIYSAGISKQQDKSVIYLPEKMPQMLQDVKLLPEKTPVQPKIINDVIIKKASKANQSELKTAFTWDNLRYYPLNSAENTTSIDLSAFKITSFDDMKRSVVSKTIPSSVIPDDATNAKILSFCLKSDKNLLKKVLLETKLPSIIEKQFPKKYALENLFLSANSDNLSLLIDEMVSNKATLCAILKNEKLNKYFNDYLLSRNTAALGALQKIISKHPNLANSNINFYQNNCKFFATINRDLSDGHLISHKFFFDKNGKISKMAKINKQKLSENEIIGVNKHYNMLADGKVKFCRKEHVYSITDMKNNIYTSYKLLNMPERMPIIQKTTYLGNPKLNNTQIMHEYVVGNTFAGVLKTNLLSKNGKNYPSLLQISSPNGYSKLFQTFQIDDIYAPHSLIPQKNGDFLFDVITGEKFNCNYYANNIDDLLNLSDKFPKPETKWKYWHNFLANIIENSKI